MRYLFFNDFLTDDHSLVRLRNSDTEYINANFVKVCTVKTTSGRSYKLAKLFIITGCVQTNFNLA
jgi:protein tyrosine phosphatase